MKAQQDVVVRSKELVFIAKTLIQDSAQKLEVDSKMHMGKPGNSVRVGKAISSRNTHRNMLQDCRACLRGLTKHVRVGVQHILR